LIDDILDFARGRLGGGFMLERNPNAPLFDHLGACPSSRGIFGTNLILFEA
jgi:hypothetical protein